MGPGNLQRGQTWGRNENKELFSLGSVIFTPATYLASAKYAIVYGKQLNILCKQNKENNANK